MQNFHIVKEYQASKSFRVMSVLGRFGLKSEHIREEFTGSIDIDNDWSIGVIFGASGTGKSTIAKEVFAQDYILQFQYGKSSVIDEMPEDKDFDTITNTFNSTGFATVWSWLKPYHVLSTGEKMRVDLARAILENRKLIVFDEFTSVVNREVAKCASAAISKTIKRLNKQFIAVSCHEDIIEWLEPDWVFNTNEMALIKKKYKDQKLMSKYINAKETHGNYLDVITI